MVRNILLLCGVLSSLVYISRDFAALLSYPGYDFANQVVSELSAIDLPSRSVDVAMGRSYSALMLLFSAGIWLSAGGRRGLRVAAVLLAAATLYGAFWPPMHMRGAAMGLTDTLHIVWTGVWLVLMLVVMTFAGRGTRKAFSILHRCDRSGNPGFRCDDGIARGTSRGKLADAGHRDLRTRKHRSVAAVGRSAGGSIGPSSARFSQPNHRDVRPSL